jgi:hypothetical protein
VQFAANEMLDIPEKDLRDLIRILNNAEPGAVEAAGVIRMNAYSRQGRQPQAYPSRKLIFALDGIRKLAQELKGM